MILRQMIDHSPYMEIPSSVYLLPISFIFFLILIKITSKWKKPLPPGPYPWPILGNILHMGKMPHISLTNFARLHGPLISLKLGSQLLVVASSPAAAAEILKTHDRLLSARYVPKVTPYKSFNVDKLSLIWSADCTDHWKSLRTLCRTELFSAKAVESQGVLREKKVRELVDYLRRKEGEVVNIGEIVFTTVFNTMGHLLFSRDFFDLDDQGAAGGLKGLIWKMMELGMTPNISDFYPILASLDLQGLMKKSGKCVKEMYGVWEILIKERREKQDLKTGDFLDVFLANGFNDDQINILVFELFTAATDTTSTTVEWGMTELVKNEQVMNKLREELRREIKQSFIKENSISNLPYLNACVKETLRLHPPAPFLLPHRAAQTCEVMNFTIPKDSQILVNVWAIGRDPTVWKDPLVFNPDRFLDSVLEFKGQDFEFIPFGAGRRMCPGFPMATKQVSLILGNLIHCFEWSLPNDGNPKELSMNEKFGITLQKEQPLLLIPKTKV